MNSVKEIALELCNNNEHLKNFKDNEKHYLSFKLAEELFDGSLFLEDIATRIPQIQIPEFEAKKSEEADDVDIKKLPVNRQIMILYKRGFSPRQIMKEVDKTYTRVKNIIKKSKDND